jgi:hypothetical protein
MSVFSSALYVSHASPILFSVMGSTKLTLIEEYKSYKFLTIQFYLVSYCSLCHIPKYLLQHSILEDPLPILLRKVKHWKCCSHYWTLIKQWLSHFILESVHILVLNVINSVWNLYWK